MGDISRMASCSAGKCSAAALRRKLEARKDESTKSLQRPALLPAKSSLLGKNPYNVMALECLCCRERRGNT